MPVVPRVHQKFRRRVEKRKQQLENRLRLNRNWHQYLPPQAMRKLVEDTALAEKKYEPKLKAVAENVLARFFGHQALELVTNREGFSELPAEHPKMVSPIPLNRKERDVLRSQQRARSLSEGIGIVAQQAFLSELRKQHPKIYRDLIKYYDPFQVITQWGFHQPVFRNAGETMGLGRAEVQTKYLVLQNKHNPKDIRYVLSDVWANIQHAPTVLLWVNEASEALAVLSLKKSQLPLAKLGEERKEVISNRIHSLQLRNLRYQYGVHFLKIVNPIFERVAQSAVREKKNDSISATTREIWDRFLSLPIKEQDRLLDNILHNRGTEREEHIQELKKRLGV